MGLEIEREFFEDTDYSAFSDRLRLELAALKQVLERPGFGTMPASIGAELELHLVDASGRPSPVNHRVVGQMVDSRVALEVDRFNLEINTHPERLEGRPFTRLAAQLDESLRATARAAHDHDARVVTTGILPTLVEQDLERSALTDKRRYRALANGMRRLRPKAPSVRIVGEEELEVTASDVSFEGANTSLQVHLQVEPGRFGTMYNAAQAATGPLLSVACNSPIFLGRSLWDETRVALFRQSVDDRMDAAPDDWRPSRVSFGHGWVRNDAFELFAESVALHEPLLPICSDEDPAAAIARGDAPQLYSLRLHHGTVWRWNRAVYDPNGGGNLRIELRVLPAGPSVVDMVANMAYGVGLLAGLEPDLPTLLSGLTFGHARRNFYEAARLGIRAELIWPDSRGMPRAVPASTLFVRLLPVARDGLCRLGVDPAEAATWLEVVERRVHKKLTGASWQKDLFRHLLAERDDRQRAAHALLERYQELSSSGAPLFEWPER